MKINIPLWTVLPRDNKKQNKGEKIEYLGYI